jgi:hypothetical protein
MIMAVIALLYGRSQLSLCIAGFSGFGRFTQTSPSNMISDGLVHTGFTV